MSIHEVVYDKLGRITETRLLDETIEAVQKDAKTVMDLQRISDRLPNVSEAKHINPLHNSIHTTDSKYPKRVKAITAISTDSVQYQDVIEGWSLKGYVKIPISSVIYSGEEINRAKLRIGNIGYVYTETPVFEPPKIPRIQVLKNALGF